MNPFFLPSTCKPWSFSCTLFEATLHAMKQKKPRGLLAKVVLYIQHFPPDRQISYKNHLKSQLHANIWIKIDQLDVTCFIISLFTAQHVSNISTSFFRSLRIIVDLFHVLYCSGSMCVGVTVWFGWGGVVSLCRLKRSFSLHKDAMLSSK